ncbi:MAG: germination protein YpeB [Vulcanibacillus sp.]
MYKKITYILIPILTIALVGAGYFGYQENQEKNSILIKAENQYQRAFHDLNYHIEKLEDEIGKTLAVSTRNQLSPSLANVWRLSYSAQSDVGQLPLVLIPFNKTEEFLSKVADFSYRIAIRDLNADPLSEEEYNTLRSLYNNSKEIQKELQSLQTKVMEENLRWMDVELAMAKEDDKADNTIVDGFKTIDKKVEEFPETDWGPGITTLEIKKKEMGTKLDGSPINKDKAKEIALSFLKLKDVKTNVVLTGEGSSYEVYNVTVEGKDFIYFEVTKIGGHVTSVIKNREIKDKKLTDKQAIEKATDFLKEHKYVSMVPNEMYDFDNSLIINFLYEQNGVIVYPDKISVKVALDNGEIINFQSLDYVINNKTRQIATPLISKDDAKSKTNPNLKISSVKLAIIENIDGNEVLTYEVTGRLDDNIYRIYINADNGNEEDVEKVTEEIIYY